MGWIMTGNKKPWLNESGCHDPTAYEAVENVSKEESSIDKDAHKIVSTIKNILDVSGFELVDRIQLRHKKTGKIYK